MPNKTSSRMSDKAYNLLKGMIIRLEFLPGAPLEEAELVKRLGVGRTPLREALQLLSQEYLVTNIHRKGYFVSNLSVNDPIHVFEVRQKLESFSARLAAERSDEGNVTDLHSWFTEASENSDNKDLDWNLETDRRFHQLIAIATENPFLQQILDHLFNQSIRVLKMFNIKVTNVQTELPIYKKLIDAIEKHNPDQAEKIMQEHLGIDSLLEEKILRNVSEE